MLFERLDDVFVRRKIASYRSVRNLLARHDVRVNGRRVLRRGFPLRAGQDAVCIDGKALELAADVYLMMNKPCGYECSHAVDRYATVFSLVPQNLLPAETSGRLHCVGRLDVDTEGLLLLTSNGMFSHRLASPRSHVAKRYHVWLRTAVHEAERQDYVERCAAGVFMAASWNAPAEQAAPAMLRWPVAERRPEAPHGMAPDCEVTLYEGKYHEVKRIFVALGNEVVALRRVSLGKVCLDPRLAPGAVRPLSDDELAALATWTPAQSGAENAPCP